MSRNQSKKDEEKNDGRSNDFAGLKNDDDDDDIMDDFPRNEANQGRDRFENENEDVNVDENDEGYIVMEKNKSMETDDVELYLDDSDVEVVEPAGLPLPVAPPPPAPLEHQPVVADVVSNPELLSLLIIELRSIAMASGNYMSVTNMNDAIHYEKAQNILEATAGDVYTAAQLYWDDYLATLQEQQLNQQEEQQQQQEEKNDHADDIFNNDEVLDEYQLERMGSPPQLPPEPEEDIDHAAINNTNKIRRYRRGMDPDNVLQQNPLPLPDAEQAEAPTINNDGGPMRRGSLEKNKDLPWESRRRDRIRLVQHRKMLKELEQEGKDHLQQILLNIQQQQRHQGSSGTINESHRNGLSAGMQPPEKNNDPHHDDNVILPHRRSQQRPPPEQQQLLVHHQRNNDDTLRFFAQTRNVSNAFLDVNDDIEEIIVRRTSSKSNNAKQRLLQFLKDSKNNNDIPIVEPISVKRRKLAKTNKTDKTNEDDESVDSTDDDDNEDDYLSDNDWIWESLANMSSYTESSPISLPMDLLWGGSYSAAKNSIETNATSSATEVATNSSSAKPSKIIETKVTDEHGRTKKVVKMNAQQYLESTRKAASRQRVGTARKSLPPADEIEPSSSLAASIVDDTGENGIPMDEEDHEDVDDETNVVNNDDIVAGIPRTWMSAGFHLVKTSVTGTNDSADLTDTTGRKDKSSIELEASKIIGLAVLPPNENDFAYNMWKKQQADNEARHATIPLPYHCRSITALLSIVTGLMYTGATVESGGHVSCISSRQPLQELMIEENTKKKTNPKIKMNKGELMYKELSESDRLSREYETRLVDALTALLRVAAEASMKRKTKALQVLQTSKDPTDQRRWLLIKRKLRLVPTCWWEVPPNEIRLVHTEMPKDDMCCLPIVVSYTNIEDLRSYVKGNIRAFTTTGGCALFLETVARIHGKGSLSHMIRRSRKAAGHTGADVSIPLLCCQCNQRHYETLDKDPILVKSLKAQSKKGIQYDTTPKVHSCLSTELLSLLLVGRVHSTLQGWSTTPLGLGVLSNSMNDVGRGLTRPEKPVWILRGPSCYSVMWLNECSDHMNSFARTDHSGTVASMTHWNCWHSVRNATQLRLVTDRSNSTVPDTSASMNCTMAHRSDFNEFLVRECNQVELVDAALFVSNEDMEHVTVHPDDPNFYPNLYRMWRYDMIDEPILDNDNDDSKDRKSHAPVWRSYHRLSDREKHVIETKLGPQICSLLWTRWPRATVDRFVPNDPLPIV